jgi:hypothetical protein
MSFAPRDWPTSVAPAIENQIRDHTDVQHVDTDVVRGKRLRAVVIADQHQKHEKPA